MNLPPSACLSVCQLCTQAYLYLFLGTGNNILLEVRYETLQYF